MLIKMVTAGVLLVAGLLMSGLAMAQDARLDLVRKAVPSADIAAARADADARANNRATLDNDVKNKLGQKQAATGIGLGTGGKSTATAYGQNTNTVKSENTNTLKTGDVTNVNTLKTGDVTNISTNINKNVQSFGIPSVKAPEIRR